jgi:hypothetical protein
MNQFKAASKWLALLALAGTIVPPVLFAFKLLGESPMKWSMLLATVLWFAAAPFWLKGGER